MLFELDFNVETGLLNEKNGKVGMVSGEAAIKIWIYKALKTLRQAGDIYGGQFGRDDLPVTTDYALIKQQATKNISEALIISPYVKNVADFKFQRTFSGIAVAFLVQTVFGRIQEEFSFEYL